MAPPQGTDISLVNLFKMFGLESNIQIKMYRHVNHVLAGKYPADVEKLNTLGDLEPFQTFQPNHILGEGYVAFFIGENDSLSRFTGIWKVLDHGRGNAKSKMGSAEYFEFFNDDDYWYGLEKDHRFGCLVDRLIIRWPTGRASHRWLIKENGAVTDFDVHSIRAKGLGKPFPGFGRLLLSYSELCDLAKNGDGGNGWIEALRSTRGVYLISDVESGGLYVGSATGSNGFFGRWQDYAKNIHGGNKHLKEALESGDLNPENLCYSILETISNLAERKEGNAAEVRWKNKFGKSAITLNAN